MKKIIPFLCTVLLLYGISLPAKAEETSLSFSIPKQHTVTIESNGGRIAADGTIRGEETSLERHREQTYWILPDPGKVLVTLLYNGEDVTDQVKNGVFTAPSLVRDAELTAIFADAPPAPDDKTYSVGGTVTDADGNLLTGVTIELGGTTDVTDEDGHFDMTDIPSGTHTVMITDKDGNVIGHGEITIVKADGSGLTMTKDENGNPVVKPSTDTENISLTLEIGPDGSIATKSAADTTPEPPGSEPKTGDNSNLWMWSMMLLICSGTLFVLLPAKKRKNVV